MKQLPLNNTYALLALFLAPDKSEETLFKLKNVIVHNHLELGPLLLQANLQMCTPLWYSRLEQDGLLEYFPEDFQHYLKLIYDANAERNQDFQSGLAELLTEFEKEGIETLLLKGAATFVDGLYLSGGARVMGDMDILVDKTNLIDSEAILDKLQYAEVPDENRVLNNKPTSERHHHINVRTKADSPVVVEIHFKPAFGQGGRIFTSEAAWKNKQAVVYDKHKTAILDPHHRLLLNTLHALLPHREFLYGTISLLQLAEFAALVSRYEGKINWEDWYTIALKNRMEPEFLSYLSLACHLMELPWPEAVPYKDKKSFHYQRIINTGGACSRLDGASESLKEAIIRYSATLYFWLKLPGWIWNNTCYAPNWVDFPDRVYLLLKKVFSAKSRAKI